VLTAIAWIILIISIILLITIASPIRLSCKAAYSETSHNTSFSVTAHYINPLILRIEYSSKEDEHIRLFILGFEKKRRDNDDDVDTKTERDDGIDIDNTSDINTDSVNDNDINTNGINTSDVNTDGINDNVDDTIFDDINTNNNINTDDINTTDDTDTKNDADAKGKIRSLLSSIKSKIDYIKRSRIYKIVRNKPLREKLLRWLKRSAVHAIRIASFEKLKVHVKIGTHDPAALGKIYGYFHATKSALALQNYKADLSMEPIFMEKRLDIDSELKLKTTLSIILWRLIAIAATFPYLKIKFFLRRKGA
jgi:hypothetical protein